MTQDTVGRLGHLNLLEFGREQARWSDAGRVEEHEGVVLVAAGTTLPFLFNAAGRVDDDADAGSVITAADDFFGRLGRGYSVMVRDTPEDADLGAACEAAGLKPFGDAGSPEMVCRTRLADAEPPMGVELRWVTSPQEVADFTAVNSAAYATYGMPTNSLADTITNPSRFLASPHLRSVVAYIDGEPVAAAQTLLSHGIAGVYWVGTLEPARGKGLGEAVTRAVTNLAFDLGAACNTLQASVMGAPIYLRMGYETIYHHRAYVRWSVRA